MAQDYPDLYLRGTINGWTAPEEHRFTRNGSIYTLHLAEFSGEFKIAEAQWGGIEYGADIADGPVTVGAGEYLMKRYGGHNYHCTGMTDVTFTFEYRPDQDLTLIATGIGIEQPQPPVVVAPSGTLPLLHINVYTDDSHTELDNEVISYYLGHKNYFTHAVYWLDLNGCDWMAAEGAESIGSETDPLPLQIKARGNWTRTGYSKKPFKIKLDSKQPMLGLSKSKHFALLAHADDNCGYLKNFVGFNLGHRIGLPWTPSAQPVELIINGNYRGLYFLTESIRVEKDRVNITELDDSASDPAICSGGYLVELDNYDETNQIQMDEKSYVGGYCDRLRVTFDTPEEYSDIQRRFITDQFTAMNDAVGSCDEVLWQYLDLDDAARYYVVEEIISNVEAYHGSTYLFRDRGEDQKWHFSPLWDCGNAFNGPTNDFFYNNAPYGCTWIASIYANASFYFKVCDTWRWFMQNKFDGLYDDIAILAGHISEAAKTDRRRWAGQPTPPGGKEVVDNSDMQLRKEWVLDNLRAKTDWLKTIWGDWTDRTYSEPCRNAYPSAPLPEYLLSGVENVAADSPAPADDTLYDLQGRPVTNPAPGLYIRSGALTVIK